VLDRYRANGGTYQEVVIADAAHAPHIEKPEEFLRALLGVAR
jgi:pimeloyl-ACP methyl ester carboxylesterase